MKKTPKSDKELNYLKFNGEFNSKLLNAHSNCLNDLIARAFSYEQLERFACGHFEHCREIMSLEMARLFTKLYSEDIKELNSAPAKNNVRFKFSTDEEMHVRAVVAFLSECEFQHNMYAELVTEIGDPGKTTEECENIKYRTMANEHLLAKAVGASELAAAAADVILYHVNGDDCHAYYTNSDLRGLLSKLGNYCHNGTFRDHSQVKLVAHYVSAVLQTLEDNPHYKRLRKTERTLIYDNNSSVSNFTKELKNLLAQREISIDPELQIALDDLKCAYECQVHNKDFYSYTPAPEADGTPAARIFFTDPVQALTFLLSAEYESYGLIIGDKKIAECIKNSGDDTFKSLLTPKAQRDLLKGIGATVKHHRWVLPKAYHALTQLKSKAAQRL